MRPSMGMRKSAVRPIDPTQLTSRSVAGARIDFIAVRFEDEMTGTYMHFALKDFSGCTKQEALLLLDLHATSCDEYLRNRGETA